ncbi:enoyl-CoA hydratase [Halioglobus japonicus]|uniref:Enoyl-CoA hydratase n=1 Tax=Halioglobus japonicus TaxID=930805 RepID=A0AAP8SMK7_9GAMM|nr:enoyl-CoA hydratase-related protein [Halioglobus japonicus]PLW85634.1 enoyl-CoA hydratase [Halioglobus japonicus]GHD16658.1 enoyl-CoA hydratase [Halioglobus japonicus]
MTNEANPYAEGQAAQGRYGENGYEVVLIDEPSPGVRRIALNRPDKRNALNHQLRGELLHALEAGDADPKVKVMIVRGSGKCFSAGYDLGGGNVGQAYPFHTAGGDSQWPRHVVESWMRIWDLSKPVIAEVHGYCLAGGSELATGCDVVYAADDAQIGYPAVRFGVPDMQFHPWLLGMRKGMEMLLTGDSVSGTEAVQYGWATRSFPAEELEAATLAQAERIAAIPADILALNKRAVHRQMEAMGLRAGLRQGTEICTLATHQQSFKDFIAATQGGGKLTEALSQRDGEFGDYREDRGD